MMIPLLGTFVNQVYVTKHIHYLNKVSFSQAETGPSL